MRKANKPWFVKAAEQKATPKVARPPFVAKCVRALKPGEAMTIKNGFVRLIKL